MCSGVRFWLNDGYAVLFVLVRSALHRNKAHGRYHVNGSTSCHRRASTVPPIMAQKLATCLDLPTVLRGKIIKINSFFGILTLLIGGSTLIVVHLHNQEHLLFIFLLVDSNNHFQ
jgi:hypothetical protein